MSRGALSLVFSLDNKPCKRAVAVHWLGVTIPVANLECVWEAPELA